MQRKLSSLLLLAVFLGVAVFATAQAAKPIQLPAPQTDGGRPLMQVLKDRHSAREFGPGALNHQVLSNMLWAAFGINRPDGHRTAPSAMNWQEITIYVFSADGVYTYDAKANTLNPVLSGDLRAAAGVQSYVKDAAVNLVYVADTTKTSSADSEQLSYADVGFIAQNVYLFGASEGLNVVVRAYVDKPTLSKTLNLPATQKIILAQSVGLPKK